MPWSRALARLVRAGVAAGRGHDWKAVELLAASVDDFEGLEMHFAESARRKLGLLVGGDNGRGMVSRADSWMTGQEINNPSRMATMLVPWHSS